MNKRIFPLGEIFYILILIKHTLTIFQPKTNTMKAYALVVLSLLILFFSSCENDCPPAMELVNPCHWDEEISDETADEIKSNWQNKWDFPPNSPFYEQAKLIPDSFFVNRFALEFLSIGHCGFRVYYGLTEPGNITSMCLVITAINDHLGDILPTDSFPDRILFTNTTIAINSLTDSLDIPTDFISLNRAQELTRNWRCYNQVSRNSDVIGSVTCDIRGRDKFIPARGVYGDEVEQLITLGNAFASKEVFLDLAEYPKQKSAYVLYNAMYALKGNKGFRKDLYIEGYGVIDQKDGKDIYAPFEIIKSGEGGLAIDITGGCPYKCNIEDALQAD